jgi:alpha-L-fucosidase
MEKEQCVKEGLSLRGMPTPQQIVWHEMEMEMFLCLDPCTWQGREKDDHSMPLDRINPSQLDTDQWCRAAQSFDAKQILFVAKHTGGFCWWQTETSDYSIKNTPYKGGKGDVLADLARSCREHGLKLGIYIYPGDDCWGAGIGSGGRTKDPAKQDGYTQVLRQQWTEVLSRYGDITEVWFDGSCIIEVGDILKKYAPDAMVFQGPHATLRWPGNEHGVAPYPTWQTVKKADAFTGVSTGLHSDPDGDGHALHRQQVVLGAEHRSPDQTSRQVDGDLLPIRRTRLHAPAQRHTRHVGSDSDLSCGTV